MRYEKDPKLKESTAQGYVFGLRAFLGWIVDGGKLRENVALKVELDEYTDVALQAAASAAGNRAEKWPVGWPLS